MNRKVFLLLALSLASLILLRRSISLNVRSYASPMGLVRWGARATEFLDPLHPNGPTTVCRGIIFITIPDYWLHQAVVARNLSSQPEVRYPSMFFRACFSENGCNHYFRGRDEIEVWLDVDSPCPI